MPGDNLNQTSKRVSYGMSVYDCAEPYVLLKGDRCVLGGYTDIWKPNQKDISQPGMPYNNFCFESGVGAVLSPVMCLPETYGGLMGTVGNTFLGAAYLCGKNDDFKPRDCFTTLYACFGGPFLRRTGTYAASYTMYCAGAAADLCTATQSSVANLGIFSSGQRSPTFPAPPAVPTMTRDESQQSNVVKQSR